MACLQPLVDLVEKAGGREPSLIGADQQRQILGHEACLDGADHDLFQRLGEAGKLGIVVELGAMLEPAGPGEDRRRCVGRRRSPLLMLPVVAGDGAVRGFREHGLAVRRHQHARHQPERAEALRHGVGLHVAVVVLARPHIAAGPFQRRSHHVVDQPVLVSEPAPLELLAELSLIHLGEDILEAPVIGLEDRVLGGEIDRIVAHQPVIQARTREVADRIVEIEHGERHAAALELVHLMLDARAVLADEADGELALARHAEVRGAVDIAIGMTADDDRLGPAWHEPRDVAANDRLAEDHPAQDVADRPVRRLPHLLEPELLHPRLVGGDGRAFDADAALLDGVGGVDGHLVFGGVAVLDGKIEGAKLDVEVRLDQLVLDQLPDDPRHLIPVEIDDGVLHHDLVQWKSPAG